MRDLCGEFGQISRLQRFHYFVFVNDELEDVAIARANRPVASYLSTHEHHPGSLCMAGACRDNSALLLSAETLLVVAREPGVLEASI